MQHQDPNSDPTSIQLPRPTAWPLVLALGISLVMASMVTSIVVGVLGLLLSIAGAVGWFFQVLPHEVHEAVPVSAEPAQVMTARTIIVNPEAEPRRREVRPIETFKFSTGIKGGIAGGAAMTLPAAIFSLLKYHSIWYAMNLLAAGGFVSWAGASDAFLSQFHLQGLLAGLMIHGLTSLLVGLLYGAMLPMFPRYPILTAGVVVPLMFTGLQYSVLGIVSPILDQRIDWFWFFMSQIAFGLVCGYVVNLHTRVRSAQFRALPFAVRAGLHSGLSDRPSDHTETEDKSTQIDEKKDSPK
jgi:hypothetical protein